MNPDHVAVAGIFDLRLGTAIRGCFGKLEQLHTTGKGKILEVHVCCVGRWPARTCNRESAPTPKTMQKC